jgi:hypothetical protein
LGLGDSDSPSKKSSLICRVVHITLALYLLPAVLIVLAVGVAGILVLEVVRFFALAVLHAAKAYRLARLFRLQEKGAAMMDRHDSP